MISTKTSTHKTPPHEFQATEDTEEDPVIPYPTNYLNINHETPTEQAQAPEEPPEDLTTVAVQPPMTEKNRPHQPSTGVRRSARVLT